MKYKNIIVDAVIVTFNADYNKIIPLVDSIYKQMRTIYIIDNTENKSRSISNFNLEKIYSKVRVYSLCNNKGIAYAQNIGIKESIKNSSRYILLSDQDTLFPINYLQKMFKDIKDNGFNIDEIAAIAPLFRDINRTADNTGFTVLSRFYFKKFYPLKGFHNIFEAISSGLILNSKLIPEIGLMKEELFIDWVDYEWCWRANKKGYKIIGNANVIIHHELGTGSINLGFKEVNIRSPLRSYYITRNAFYLALRNKSLDNIHKFFLFLISFKYVIGFFILSNLNLKQMKFTILGFLHGIVGNMGKYNDKN